MTPTRLRRAAAIVLAALSAVLGLFALHVTGSLPAPSVLAPWWSWTIEAGVALTLVLRAVSGQRERGAWLAMAVGCASFCGGDIYYTTVNAHLSVVPFPSPADGLYLGFYVACLLALGLLVRSRVGRFSASVWLDALIGSLSVGGFGAALVLPPVLSATGGQTLTVITNLVYPLADLLLLTIAVGTVALMGWRPGRGLAMVVAALAFFAVTDSLYLYRTALGTYRPGTLLDVGWEVALVLLGIAAWQPVRRAVGSMHEWATLVAPLALGTLSLGLLVYDHFARVDLAAILLAAGALAAVLFRLALTFAEHLQTLGRSRTEALTDALTGLGNRRALMHELARATSAATTEAPVMFVLFDLDGFKNYNDRFGHPAGDDLLRRLGHALQATAGPSGSAYRLGGDEFCMLSHASARDFDQLVSCACDALCEGGEGFTIESSYGRVDLPRDACDAETAMHEADRLLYTRKNGGRASASSQGSAVLLRALEACHPDLGHSLDQVMALAGAVARLLGLPAEHVDEIQRAAGLHDIGKVGIPDAILQKSEPLTPEEWAYVQRHTLIGQRILDAAPALASTGLLVRSSHEHWNGLGYPDQLAGEEIPLGSRIILACDAFDAMTSDRPYSEAMSQQQALAELRSCSGSQFDPAVVQALITALAPAHGNLVALVA